MKPEVRAILDRVRDSCDFDYVAFTDINDVNCFGSNALHYLAIRGDTDAARILISEGIHVDQHGEHGYTPLHEAASAGNLEFVRLLLESGADPLARTEGDLPFTVARLSGQDAVCELISEYVRKRPPDKAAKVWDAHMTRLSHKIDTLERQIDRECPDKT